MRLLSRRMMVLGTAALLALAAPSARAAGINLSWNDCGAYGSAQKNFACHSMGSTPNVLVASVVTPAPMTQLVGMVSVLQVQTDQPSLSRWWSMETGGCRPAALSCTFNYVTGPYSCVDPWQGGAAGGIHYEYQYGAPNRGRIRLICGVPAPGVTSDGVSEYYMFSIVITGARSDGPGACDGCSSGACIVFDSILLSQPAEVQANYEVVSPLLRNYALWQAGTSGSVGPCPAAIPIQNATWGSLKSLYHGK